MTDYGKYDQILYQTKYHSKPNKILLNLIRKCIERYIRIKKRNVHHSNSVENVGHIKYASEAGRPSQQDTCSRGIPILTRFSLLCMP